MVAWRDGNLILTQFVPAPTPDFMQDRIAQLEGENFRLRILLAGQRDPNVFELA